MKIKHRIVPRLVAVLGSALVAVAFAFFPFSVSVQPAGWQSAPAQVTLKAAAATMPAPTSASGALASASKTSTSTYSASSYQSQSGTTTTYGSWELVECATTECGWTCSVTGAFTTTSGSPPPPPSSPCETSSPTYSTAYDCPNGGTLSGTTCYVTTTTTANTVQLSWSPTITGQFLVPKIQVVDATSCTSSTWTVLATESDITGSYTISSPSSTEYYGLRTLSGSWTGPVTSCTQG